MGYYTSFDIETSGAPFNEAQLEEDFQRITEGYSFINISDDTYKWYDHKENMVELSKLYPSTIFKVWGKGEDPDDYWYAVYCNGEYKSVNGVITYPEIDVKSIGDVGSRHPEYFI